MPDKSPFERAYAVILAGGSGTRFWPLSRRRRPKQLLRLFGSGTLVEQTVARLRGLIPPSRIYVFTNERVRGEIARRLPQVPRAQIVAEPAARNTAPAIGLAAHEVAARDREGVMVVLPSDHVILKPAAFRSALGTACRLASAGRHSVILGLKPTRPDTGYGYVRLGRREPGWGRQEVYRVQKFTEKPPLDRARRYVASGRYLWNGGMFVWRASTLIANLRRHKPEMARALERLVAAGGLRSRSAMRQRYPRLEKISIDYALMEKVSGIVAVATDLGWTDVGSWAAAWELSPKDREGNVRPRHSLATASHGNLIVSDGKFVATVGVHGLVIVETPDALLVCARGRSQDVGKVVEELDRRGIERLL